MGENEKLSEGRIETLRVEYTQILETKRDYLKTLLQIVIVYLALTGVAADYALREPGLTINLFLAGGLDILIGAFGASVMFVARAQMKKVSARLEEVCSLLGVYYEGSNIIEWAVWAIFICYLFVLLIWLIIVASRL